MANNQGSARRGSKSKASLQLSISTEIPKRSSGRALDALTDLFRPLTEAAGLIGDKLELKRQATLSEIARKTKKRLAASRKPIKPIATKFLVPLLQRASLEDLDNVKLIDMWANLIATAATEEVELIGQYSTILSEITSDQVRLMEKILRLEDRAKAEAGIYIDNYYYMNQSGLPGSISDLEKSKNIKAFAKSIESAFDINGVAVDTINVFYRDRNRSGGLSICSPDGVYRDAKFYDFENLVRLGLLAKCEIKRHQIGIFDIDVHYYLTTPVGVDLYSCCNPAKLVREARNALS